MECTLCHIQYIDKSETQFNLRLNNHRKCVSRENVPLVDQHFKPPGSLEQLDNMNIDKDLATLRLKKQEDF